MKRIYIYACLVATILFTSSCNKALEVDVPKAKLTRDQAFADDLVAEAVVRGMYTNLVNYQGYLDGSNSSVLALAGLASDELINMGMDAPFVQFEKNILTRDNIYVLALWKSMYLAIYQANDILDGLAATTGVSENLKQQFKGEALFVRALSHFYLVNFFGKVPVITTVDYRANALATRKEVSAVYEQIEKDLLEAQQFLPAAYTNGERLRPVKAAATALLAKVYLYTGQWSKAETQATAIIQNSNYNLVALNNITVANNKEAIWQLRPLAAASSTATNEGVYFYYGVYYNALSNDVVNMFETGDNRKTEWVRFDGTVYLPNKYQVTSAGGPRSEYSTIIRLAEIYLIRAEARAKQGGSLSAAIADVDLLRGRALLPLIQVTDPGISQANLLLAIEKERRVELFTEGGHRWFDLKRTGRATAVLGPIKTGWTVNDELFPIPQTELEKNPALGSQNPGY